MYDDEIQPKHFTNYSNRCVFMALKKLFENDIKKADAFTIMQILDSNPETKRFSEDLTVDQLNELIAQSDLIAGSSQEEFKLMTKKVKDAAFRRDTFQKLQECETYCFDKDIDDIEHKIYETLDSVMLDYNAKSELKEYKDVIDGYIDDMESVKSGETQLITFPFPHLNDYVVMEPGECVCFAAPAKAGKSSMLLTILVDLLKKDKSVLYVDSEISTKLFNMRLMAHLTGIKFSVLRSGTYSREEKEIIDEQVRWLKEKKFIHIYEPTIDDNGLWMLAKKARHLIGMDVIILDYLKANSNEDKAYAVYASLGRVSDTLKNRIAGEMKVAAVTAAQTTEYGKIADSAKIARNVSTVITILEKTPEEMDPNNPLDTRKLRVVYNRNGAQMQSDEWIDMEFDGSHCKYRESGYTHARAEPF